MQFSEYCGHFLFGGKRFDERRIGALLQLWVPLEQCRQLPFERLQQFFIG